MTKNERQMIRQIATLLKEYGEIELSHSICYDILFMGYQIIITERKMLMLHIWEDRHCIFVKGYKEFKFTKKDAEELFLLLYGYSLMHSKDNT